MQTRNTALAILTLGLGLLGLPSLRADTWAPASTASYESNNKNYRFTVTPGQRFGRNPSDLTALAQAARRARLAAEARKLEEAAKAAKRQPACKGQLEQKTKQGKYDLIWEQELTNGIAPVSALVCDSGNYVVTLDNWHQVGRGDNVVVIYGPEGKLVRQLALSDFLTQEQINGLPVSVSSTWWGTGHYLDEKQKCLVLRVTRNQDWRLPGKAAQFQEVRIRLATGEVLKEPASDQAPAKLAIPAPRSLADDLKDLAGGKGEWTGHPVKIRRALTGKEEQVTPALAFLPLNKDAKLGGELDLIVGVEENGSVVGELTKFELVQEGSKRFLIIGQDWKQIRMAYTLEGGSLNLTGTKTVRLRGDGDIEFSGRWRRKN
jgi:hypothetical protein